MCIENGIRILAGCMALIGLSLGYWVHEGWYFLVVFVAVNLIQSAFTGFCPAEKIMAKAGMKPREE